MDEKEKVMMICQARYGRMWYLKHHILTISIASRNVTLHEIRLQDEVKALEVWWQEQLTEVQRNKIIKVNGELSTGYVSMIKGYKADG